MEILNLRKTANGYLINGLTETIEGDENYQNALDWDTAGKEVMPQYTQAEIDAKITQEKLSALLATDKDVPRITEDLIDLLVLKGVITLNELPVDAKNKFNNRKAKRAEL